MVDDKGASALAGNGGEGTGGEGGGGGAAGAWDSLNEEQRTFVEGRGWGGPGDLLTSYQNLEKLRGVPPDRLIVKPQQADDAEGWGKVYEALGRPPDAAGYELAAPEGDSGEFLKAATAKMHEAGLTKGQAQALAGWWGEYVQGQTTAAEEGKAAAQESDMAELRGKMGDKWDSFVQDGRRAAQKLGYDQDALTEIEDALGTGQMMTLMARVGSALGEGSLDVGGASAGDGFGLSGGAAKAEIERLKGDKDFLAKLNNPSAAVRQEAMAKWSRLHKAAYPG